MRYSLLFLLGIVALPAYVEPQSLATADYLRCEYRVNPLGIDVTAPRLSWEMNDVNRGAKQTAYQIMVASTRENLAAEKGDLWDSGKVASNQSSQIVYAGKPLVSRTQCFWQVRIWDAVGKPSAWSEPAMWTMGLLNPDDWQAKWIGHDKEPSKAEGALPVQGCSLAAQGVQGRAADPPRHALRQRAGRLSNAFERQTGGRRLFHARLDRLQQTGLLQHLRRDRVAQARPERDRRHLGTGLVQRARRLVERRQALRAASSALCPVGNRIGKRPANRTSPATIAGKARTVRTSKARCKPAKPTTPRGKSPAGISPASTKPLGNRSP